MATAPRNPLEIGLGKNPANFATLTPLTFIAWSAHVYPRRFALPDGELNRVGLST